jgi:flagellar assembly protein FliH
MPSSTEPLAPSVAGPVASPVAGPPGQQTSLAGVRPARFDRPLAGAAAAARGGAWGDPALDAVLADVVADARQEGLAQGYAAGWAAGRRVADEQAEAEAAERAASLASERAVVLGTARTLLEGLAAAASRRAEEPTWADLADTLADGALTIARAALARELSGADDLAARVRAALRGVAGDGRAVVHLAPGDAAGLEGQVPDGVLVVADPSVAPGVVVARSDTQRLRIDVPAAVAAAEEVLRS